MPKTYMDIADKKSPLANPFQNFDHREFLCGWGSAFINITMTYPLYKTIFRQVRIFFWFPTSNICKKKLSFADASWSQDWNGIRAAATRRHHVSVPRNVPTARAENSFTFLDVRRLRCDQTTRHRILSRQPVHRKVFGRHHRWHLRGGPHAIRTCSNHSSRRHLPPKIQKYSSRIQVRFALASDGSEALKMFSLPGW